MTSVDEMIEANKGLVYKQLWKFGLAEDNDAESIAFEALFNAISTYDSASGTKLSTYATVIIYNALGSYVRTLNGKRKIRTISYNNITCTDDNGEHEMLETLASSGDLERDYVHKELCRFTRQSFDELHSKVVNEKHKLILSIWRDSEFAASTIEIAYKANVSQSYVSQVLNNFKHRLKKKLEDMYYD